VKLIRGFAADFFDRYFSHADFADRQIFLHYESAKSAESAGKIN
jgi:hypothetical protein